LFICLALSL